MVNNAWCPLKVSPAKEVAKYDSIKAWSQYMEQLNDLPSMERNLRKKKQIAQWQQTWVGVLQLTHNRISCAPLLWDWPRILRKMEPQTDRLAPIWVK